MTDLSPRTHEWPIRIYYEDTDFGGIVYYANYMKFIERARTEWVREMGIDQIEMKKEGLVFAVRRVEADYFKPAFYDDQLTVRTRAIKVTPVRLICEQSIWRDDVEIFKAVVTLACLGANGAAPLPERLRQQLA